MMRLLRGQFFKTGIFLLLLSMTACTVRKPKGALNGYSGDAYQIISNKCFQCHAGGNSEGDLSIIDNANTLISRGYIVPGDALNSTFYQKITTPEFGQRMPFGGPYLSQSDIDTIKTWIDGIPSSASSCKPHNLGTNPSFELDVKPLLNADYLGTDRRCSYCHARPTGTGLSKWLINKSSNSTPGASASVEYAQFFATSGCSSAGACAPTPGPMVIAGDPCNSTFYQRISQTSGPVSGWKQMPKFASKFMSDAQLGIIYTWILNGAPNN
jgi:hypothetical protein